MKRTLAGLLVCLSFPWAFNAHAQAPEKPKSYMECLKQQILLGADPKYDGSKLNCADFMNDLEKCTSGRASPDERIALCTKAIESTAPTKQDQARAFAGRAGAHFAKRDYPGAIADYDQALALDPTDPNVYIDRGAARYNTRDYDRALADYSEALKLDPKRTNPLSRASAHYYRGDLWTRKREFALALSDFDEAMRLDPGRVGAYDLAAWLLATAPVDSLRNGTRAVELATRAVELSKEKVGSYLDTLAAAHAEAGNFDEAVRWQQKALEDAEFAKRAGEQMRQRLDLYRKRQPYRETPKS